MSAQDSNQNFRDSVALSLLTDPRPTLENLARHIYREAKSRLPEVCRVRLSRPSSGQSCVYEEG